MISDGRPQCCRCPRTRFRIPNPGVQLPQHVHYYRHHNRFWQLDRRVFKARYAHNATQVPTNAKTGNHCDHKWFRVVHFAVVPFLFTMAPPQDHPVAPGELPALDETFDFEQYFDWSAASEYVRHNSRYRPVFDSLVVPQRSPRACLSAE
jgi:hypothetical protein